MVVVVPADERGCDDHEEDTDGDEDCCLEHVPTVPPRPTLVVSGALGEHL